MRKERTPEQWKFISNMLKTPSGRMRLCANLVPSMRRRVAKMGMAKIKTKLWQEVSETEEAIGAEAASHLCSVIYRALAEVEATTPVKPYLTAKDMLFLRDLRVKL